MVRIRWNRVLSLILAALRGFCLFISEKHTVGISAKNPLEYYTPPYSGLICLKFMNYLGITSDIP